MQRRSRNMLITETDRQTETETYRQVVSKRDTERQNKLDTEKTGHSVSMSAEIKTCDHGICHYHSGGVGVPMPTFRLIRKTETDRDM